MTEEFNPNAFRKQMAQQAGQIPAPVAAPQQAPVQNAPMQNQPVQNQANPVPMQPQPYVAPVAVPAAPAPVAPAGQNYAPQQMAPMPQQPPAPQYPGHAQQAAHPQGQPQSVQPQGGHPQQVQFQPPQQQLQQGYAQPVHPQAHHPQGHQMMPQAAEPAPKVKRSLFKRKTKPANDQAASQMPQLPNQLGAAVSALPAKDGIARPIIFAAGLMLGVIGTMVSGKVLSGGTPPVVQAVSSVSQLSPETIDAEGVTKLALTDDMLSDDDE